MNRSAFRSGASFVPPLCAALFTASAAGANVDISDGRTKHMNCSGGVCIPTAAKAVLNVNDLTAMLATSDVKVFTGNGALNIAIDTSFSWVSTNRLTLSAYQSVNVKAAVSVAGPGGVTIVTNVAGNGGDFNLVTGSIDFWDLGSSLIVNGNTYTLVPDIATLASDIAANRSGFYALAKNYDAFQDGIYPKSPIQTPLKGAFLGLGHTIDNLAINQSTTSAHVGLFADTEQGSTIANLHLTNATITAPSSIAAVLVGVSGGAVSGASVTGTVTAYNAGGVVGQNSGTVTKSQSSATIHGTQTGGGIVGESFGPVSLCNASGWVEGIEGGGIAGYSQSDISDSQSSATVMATSPTFGSSGGLVGENSGGSIEQSFATGTVGTQATKTDRHGKAPGKTKPPQFELGGLVGVSSGGTISDSYARGDVSITTTTGRRFSVAGGLVGLSTGSAILRSYATGSASVDAGFIGGVLGDDLLQNSGFTNTYWDLDTGVQDPSKGVGNIPNAREVFGQSTGKMTHGVPRGFDRAVWGQNASINNGYPYLLANPPQ